MPLHRRLPKRGFTNVFREEWAIINLAKLQELEGDTFSPEILMASGVIKKIEKGLKVLAHGEIKKAIKVTAHAISAAAAEKIKAAGGSVELLTKASPAEPAA
jgi:large subunit ribosomal protein L15